MICFSYQVLWTAQTTNPIMCIYVGDGGTYMYMCLCEWVYAQMRAHVYKGTSVYVQTCVCVKFNILATLHQEGDTSWSFWGKTSHYDLGLLN